MLNKKLQPRILYPVKISIKNEGEIKTFSDKQKQRELADSRPSQQEMLKENFQEYRSGTQIYMKKGRTSKKE